MCYYIYNYIVWLYFIGIYLKELGTMEEKNSLEETIDLRELLDIFLRRIKLILLLTFAIGVIAFLVSKFFITPLYTASATMYVNNTKKTVVDSVNTSDLTASQLLATTYVEMIKSDNVLAEVAQRVSEAYKDRLKEPLQAKDIRAMVSASPKNETEILAVYVQSPDPKLSMDITNEIVDVAPNKIKGFVEASSVKTIDEAILPEKPSSPNVIRNTLIGLFVGFVIGLGLAYLIEILDTRVKSEDDLEKMLDLPIIGVIPNIKETQETK